MGDVERDEGTDDVGEGVEPGAEVEWGALGSEPRRPERREPRSAASPLPNNAPANLVKSWCKHLLWQTDNICGIYLLLFGTVG